MEVSNMKGVEGDENPRQCPVCEGPMENWSHVNEWAKVFSDEFCDHDALKSAVDVLRMRQAQPHKSMESNLWEAIKDYAERARLRVSQYELPSDTGHTES